jgi:hypothetical protein
MPMYPCILIQVFMILIDNHDQLLLAIHALDKSLAKPYS